MWPSLTTYITEILKKPKSQVPTSSSFSTVKSAVLNKLTTAKLEFFISIAAAMRPYLQTFQSDGPLLPFITSELETLLQTLMGKFMKRAVLEGANSAYKIAKLNVLDSATRVVPSEVDIGFAAKTTLEKVYKEKKISQLQVLEFRKECESMLATTVAKIQERSPLNPFNSEIFQFFALIYNKLGGTYVTLPSQVLIQYLKLIHMHGCVYI